MQSFNPWNPIFWILCALMAATNQAYADGAKAAPTTPPPTEACKAQIRAAAAPYRARLKSIWIDDRLFMYVEALKQYSALLDQDPSLRAAIEGYKKDKFSRKALFDSLSAKIDQLAGYADSLEKKFNLPYYWHYPVIHFKSGVPNQVWLTLPTGVGSYELKMPLGPSSADEIAQAKASAREQVTTRATIGLDLPPLTPDFRDERDYLTRQGHLSPSCLASYIAAGDDTGAVRLDPPPSNDQRLVDNLSSRGRSEGGVVMGFPISDYVGGRLGAGVAQGSSEPPKPDDAPVAAADSTDSSSGQSANGGSDTPAPAPAPDSATAQAPAPAPADPAPAPPPAAPPAPPPALHMAPPLTLGPPPGSPGGSTPSP